MSLMTSSRATPERRTVSSSDCCLADRLVLSSSSVIPRTPFSGVRISWLMLARNLDFATLAASAASLAETNSCAANLSGVISEAMPR